MKNMYVLCAVVLLWGCTSGNPKELHQSKRDQVISVQDKIHEIVPDSIFISNNYRIYLTEKYLLIEDTKSIDNLIHFFDKKDFRYVTSIAPLGQGPGEIANIGHIAYNERTNEIYVSDHGKQTVFSYQLDSIMTHPDYLPTVKLRMDASNFPSEYYLVDDTLSITRQIKPIGNNDFDPTIAKWDMQTGEFTPFAYRNEQMDKRRMTIAVDVEKDLCLECFSNYDLINLYHTNGELIRSIQGPLWGKAEKNRFFGYSAICNDCFVAISTSEECWEESRRQHTGSRSTQLIVFDLQGNYLSTLETHYNINHICYDKVQDRLIIGCDDDIQLGYLDMKDINK